MEVVELFKREYLRWLLLHTAPLPPGVAVHKRTRQLGEAVREAVGLGQEHLFSLLLQVHHT